MKEGRKHMKKVFVILLVVMLASRLAACSNAVSTDSDVSEASDTEAVQEGISDSSSEEKAPEEST